MTWACPRPSWTTQPGDFPIWHDAPLDMRMDRARAPDRPGRGQRLAARRSCGASCTNTGRSAMPPPSPRAIVPAPGGAGPSRPPWSWWRSSSSAMPARGAAGEAAPGQAQLSRPSASPSTTSWTRWSRMLQAAAPRPAARADGWRSSPSTPWRTASSRTAMAGALPGAVPARRSSRCASAARSPRSGW